MTDLLLHLVMAGWCRGVRVGRCGEQRGKYSVKSI